MSEIFLDLIYLLKYIVLFTISIYTIGYVSIQFIKKNKAYTSKSSVDSFADIVTLGVFVLLTVFVMIYTRANTVFTIPLIILGLSGFYFKLFEIKKFRFEQIHFKELSLFIVVFTIISLGILLLIKYDNVFIINHDISFYARLAYCIEMLEEEKLVLDPILIGNYPAGLYHFLNEWVTVLSSKFIDEYSALKTFIVFTLPCLTTLIFFQLASVLKNLIKKICLFDLLLLSSVILLTPGLIKVIYNIVIKNKLSLSSILNSDFYFIKLKGVILISLLSYKLYIKGKERYSLIIFSLIPFVWNTVLPAYIGGVLLLFLYQYFYIKKVDKHYFSLQIISIILFLIYLLMDRDSIHPIFNFSLGDYLIEEFQNYNYFSRALLYIIVSSSPLLLVLNKKFRNLMDNDFKRYLFFIIISSLISYSFLFELHNAKQIINNILYVILFLLLVFLLSKIYIKKGKLVRIMILSVLPMVIGYAIIFRSNVIVDIPVPKGFNSSNPPLVATDTGMLNNNPFFYYIRPYSHLMLNNKHWLPVRIDLFDDNDLDSNFNKLQYSRNVSNQSFFRYVSLNSKEFDGIKPNVQKINFLKDFKFKYLIVSKTKFKNRNLSYISKLNIVDNRLFDDDNVLIELEWE